MLFAPNIFTKQNLEKFETDFTNYDCEFNTKDYTLVIAASCTTPPKLVHFKVGKKMFKN